MAIESILTKKVSMNKKDLADKLPEALWAYRTTWRNNMGQTPYELVYGKQVLLLIEFRIKNFRTAVQLGLDISEAQQQCLLQLNELDEIRRDVVQQNILVQQQCKKLHDKSIQNKQFQPGDWVLLYNSRFKHFKGKFHTHWMGPYEVVKVFENGAVEIKTINRRNFVFPVNGHSLKVYFEPLTKGDFI